MPDVDRVHKNLRQGYQKPYAELCEDRWEILDIAHDVLKPLRSDLERFGDAPIQLVGECSQLLADIADQPLFADWQQIRREFNARARAFGGNRRAIDVATDAIKRTLNEIKSGASMNGQDGIALEILEKYMLGIYDSEFDGRLLMQEPLGGIGREELLMRGKRLRSQVKAMLPQFANQVTKKWTVKKLRLPSRPKQPIGLHDNLLR